MRIGTPRNSSRRRKSLPRHERSPEVRGRWKLAAGNLTACERCEGDFEAHGVFYVEGSLCRVDLFEQAAEDFAGADLDEQVGASLPFDLRSSSGQGPPLPVPT